MPKSSDDKRNTTLRKLAAFGRLVRDKIKDKVVETVAVFIIGIFFAFLSPVLQLYEEYKETKQDKGVKEEQIKELSEKIRRLTGVSHEILDFFYNEGDSATYVIAKKEGNNTLYFYSTLGNFVALRYSKHAQFSINLTPFETEDVQPLWPAFDDYGFFTLKSSGRSFWYTVDKHDERYGQRIMLDVMPLSGGESVDVIHEIEYPKMTSNTWLGGYSEGASLEESKDVELMAWIHNYLYGRFFAEGHGKGIEAWEEYNYNADVGPEQQLLPALTMSNLPHWCEVENGFGWNLETAANSSGITSPSLNIGLSHYNPIVEKQFYVFPVRSTYLFNKYIIVANEKIAAFFLIESLEGSPLVKRLKYVSLYYADGQYSLSNFFEAEEGTDLLNDDEKLSIEFDLNVARGGDTSFCYFGELEAEPITNKSRVIRVLDNALRQLTWPEE